MLEAAVVCQVGCDTLGCEAVGIYGTKQKCVGVDVIDGKLEWNTRELHSHLKSRDQMRDVYLEE